MDPEDGGLVGFNVQSLAPVSASQDRSRLSASPPITKPSVIVASARNREPPR
jgi:hypothetical protein